MMLQSLFQFLQQIHPLPEDAVKALEQHFEIIEVPKNDYLLREGEICHYTYLMFHGLARIFYTKHGEEVNAMFIESNDFFTGTDSYYSRKGGDLNIQILQQSTIARIHYDHLQNLYNQYSDLNYIGRVITEKYFLKSEERVTLLRKQRAEDRYLFLMDRYPSLIQNIQIQHLASYLGVTFETLSRIRNKITKSELKR